MNSTSSVKMIICWIAVGFSALTAFEVAAETNAAPTPSEAQATATTKPKDSELAVCETTIREIIGKAHGVLFFITLPNESDPDDAFLARFGGMPVTVEKGSMSSVIKKDKGEFNVRHQTTGEVGVSILIGPIKWVTNESAELEICYSQSAMGFGQFFYVIERTNNTWAVTKKRQGITM